MRKKIKEASTNLVQKALEDSGGIVLIEAAKNVLFADIKNNIFNPLRAKYVFQFAIENALLRVTGSEGKEIFQELKNGGIIEKHALHLVQQFMNCIGLSD